jgi:hypothetical protein
VESTHDQLERRKSNKIDTFSKVSVTENILEQTAGLLNLGNVDFVLKSCFWRMSCVV